MRRTFLDGQRQHAPERAVGDFQRHADKAGCIRLEFYVELKTVRSEADGIITGGSCCPDFGTVTRLEKTVHIEREILARFDLLDGDPAEMRFAC